MPLSANHSTAGRTNGRSLLKWCSAVLLCALIALPFFMCGWFVYAFGVDVPVYDQWHCVTLLSRLQQGEISWMQIFCAQHGTHITGVPFVLMALLAQFTGYDLRAEMLVGVFALSAACVVLLLMAKERLPKSMVVLLALLPIAWLVMSLRQHEAMLGGVMGGLEHIAVTAFFVLTVYLLDHVVALGWPLLLAMLSATCCLFSLGNGILVLPLGALQLALSGFGFGKMAKSKLLGALAAWGIFSIAVGSFYLSIYKRSVEASVLHYFLSNPYLDLQFFLALLGSPLNAAGDTGAAIATAIVLSGIFIIMVAAVANKEAKLNASVVAPLMLIGFVVLSDFLITMSRAHFGLEQATASRYVCIGYLGIAGLYLLLLSLREQRAGGRVFLFGALMVCVIRGSVVSVNDGFMWGGVSHYYRLSIANLLRNYRLNDTGSLGVLGTNPHRVAKLAAFLEKNHLSVFRDRQPQRTWKPSQAPVVALEEVAGRSRESLGQLPVFRLDYPSGKTLCFSGWVVDQTTKGPAGGVVVCVDNKLEIPAAYGLDRPDVKARWRRRDCLRSGFSTSCATSHVGEGWHDIRIKVLSPDKRSYYTTPVIAVLKVQGLVPPGNGSGGSRDKFVAGRATPSTK